MTRIADGQSEYSPSHLADFAEVIAIAPDGNVVVTGYFFLSSINVALDTDFFTIKYQSGP